MLKIEINMFIAVVNIKKTLKINLKLWTQVDGCTMSRPLSEMLFNIYMVETKVVEPAKLQFFKRFGYDITITGYKDQLTGFFQALNNNQPKIKIAIDESRDKFLYTKIAQNNSIATEVDRQES